MRKIFLFLAFIGCLSPSICRGQDPGSIDLDLDYVMWWTNGTQLPALVSTSPAGTPQNQAGVLPGASVLFGNDRYNDSLRNGGRFTLTRWLDAEKEIALELSYFGGGSANDLDYHLNSTGAPILARPFFNTVTGQQDSQLLSFIDPASTPIVAGGISINGESEFHSASALARINSQKTRNGRIDWLLGYRFFRFREGLHISESIESTNPLGLIAQGTTLSLFDDFGTSSSFHGGEIGLGWTGSINDWLSLQGTSKIALGGVNKRLKVRGNTQVSVPGGGTASYAGGLLALPSNMGDREESDFAFLPELGVKARVLLTSNVEFNVGYSALYLTNVARVGDAVDRNIDASQLTTLDTTGVPSSGRPFSTLSDSGLFVHGISLGVAFSR
jgi:hypothetical protein